MSGFLVISSLRRSGWWRTGTYDDVRPGEKEEDEVGGSGEGKNGIGEEGELVWGFTSAEFEPSGERVGESACDVDGWIA